MPGLYPDKFAMLLASICVQTGVSPVSGEEILPRSYPASRYLTIWNNSPFLREVGDPTTIEGEAPATLDVSLEGLVIDENTGAIAYLRDSKTGEFLTATEKPSPLHSFLVMDARPNRDPTLTVVSISDGDRTADLRFSGPKWALLNGGAEAFATSNQNEVSTGSEGSLPMAEAVRDTQAHPQKTTVSGPPGKRFRIPIPDQSDSEKVREIKSNTSTRNNADSAENLSR